MHRDYIVKNSVIQRAIEKKPFLVEENIEDHFTVLCNLCLRSSIAIPRRILHSNMALLKNEILHSQKPSFRLFINFESDKKCVALVIKKCTAQGQVN